MRHVLNEILEQRQVFLRTRKPPPNRLVIGEYMLEALIAEIKPTVITWRVVGLDIEIDSEDKWGLEVLE